MSGRDHRGWTGFGTRSRLHVLAAGLGAVFVTALPAPAAFGADSVYWNSFSSSGAIRVGNLTGGPAQSLFGGESDPYGVALDPASGKVYWADLNSGNIRAGNLDGSGSSLQNLYMGEQSPAGVAIDPAAGKIYWTDATTPGAIRVANLDGSGAPQNLFTGEGGPEGVVIDPAAGKIYWSDYASGKIRVGNLNGSGVPQTLFMGEPFPEGVAIDPAAGKVYWADNSSNGSITAGIRVGDINGSGSASNLYTGGEPWGVAIDPASGNIYWADTAGDIKVGRLDGSGVPSTLIGGETDPLFLALLRAPQASGAPQVSGSATVGTTLSCSQGSWASDLLGAQLYRAPANFAYQWRLDGTDIAGANSSSYMAATPGSYTCRVTATNQAGSTALTSAAYTVSAGSSIGLPPRLSSVAQSHRRWRRGSKPARISRKRGLPVGTTFSFSLNEQASVRLGFTQNVRGRRVKGRCVKPRKGNRQRPSCSRSVNGGTLSFTGHTGMNKVFFQGRISRKKILKPGHWMVTITATNSVGRSTPETLRFTIVA